MKFLGIIALVLGFVLVAGGYWGTMAELEHGPAIAYAMIAIGIGFVIASIVFFIKKENRFIGILGVLLGLFLGVMGGLPWKLDSTGIGLGFAGIAIASISAMYFRHPVMKMYDVFDVTKGYLRKILTIFLILLLLVGVFMLIGEAVTKSNNIDDCLKVKSADAGCDLSKCYTGPCDAYPKAVCCPKGRYTPMGG